MPETNFFWDPASDNILQERDETGALTADYTTEPRLYGNVISQNRSGLESYFHYDALGSTLAVTGDGQQVTGTRGYTAFGEATERTGSTEFPFQFVGQKGYYLSFNSDFHVLYVRRRPYVPIVGRWAAADPRGPQVQDPNTFAYVRNSPVIAFDPSGLESAHGSGNGAASGGLGLLESLLQSFTGALGGVIPLFGELGVCVRVTAAVFLSHTNPDTLFAAADVRPRVACNLFVRQAFKRVAEQLSTRFPVFVSHSLGCEPPKTCHGMGASLVIPGPSVFTLFQISKLGILLVLSEMLRNAPTEEERDRVRSQIERARELPDNCRATPWFALTTTLAIQPGCCR